MSEQIMGGKSEAERTYDAAWKSLDEALIILRAAKQEVIRSAQAWQATKETRIDGGMLLQILGEYK